MHARTRRLVLALLPLIVAAGSGLLLYACDARFDPLAADTLAAGDCGGSSMAMSYESLVDTITKKDVRNIDDLLPKLPEWLRHNFLLVPVTQSLQDGSNDKPRIVLYDGCTALDSQPGTANLILAFAGEAPSGDDVEEDVEVIRWRDACKCTDFFRIRFTKANGSWQAAQFEDGKSDTGHSAKPAVCADCHRGKQAADDLSMRWNFSTYPAWTSIYGTDGDQIYGDATTGSPERTRFVSFLDNGRKTFRYQQLVDLVTAADVAGKDRIGTHNWEGGGLRALGNNFHKAIQIMNSQRIANWMTKSDDYACYKWAMMSALNADCKDTDIRDFIPASRLPNHATAYSTTLTQTQDDQTAYYKAKTTELVAAGQTQAYAETNDTFSLNGEADERYRIAKLRYIFETRTKGSISIEHFASNKRADNYSFDTAYNFNKRLAADFAAASGLGTMTCDQLKQAAANACAK